jgi:hypothetical protein
MRANQLRLWFASMAYVLLCALRRIALHHTPFAKATCGIIRLKRLKIGALVRVSVRLIKVAMASTCPAAHAWGSAARRLAAANCIDLVGDARGCEWPQAGASAGTRNSIQDELTCDTACAAR